MYHNGAPVDLVRALGDARVGERGCEGGNEGPLGVHVALPDANGHPDGQVAELVVQRGVGHPHAE